MPAGERCRRAVCGRTARTVRCGGGRQPQTSRHSRAVPGRLPPTLHCRGPALAVGPAAERWAGRVVLVARCEADVVYGAETCVRVGACTRSQRGRRDSLCPKAAVRAMPSRLLLLCVLFRSSWLAVEGGRGRRRQSAASPGRTGRRGRVGRRGWWRSAAAASARLDPGAETCCLTPGAVTPARLPLGPKSASTAQARRSSACGADAAPTSRRRRPAS
jgi:hypothetical protein